MNETIFHETIETPRYITNLISSGTCIPGIYRKNENSNSFPTEIDDSFCACRVPDNIVVKTSQGEEKKLKKGGYIVFFNKKIWAFDEEEFHKEYTDITKTDGFYDYYLVNKEQCTIPEEEVLKYYGIIGFVQHTDAEFLEDFTFTELIRINALIEFYIDFQEATIAQLEQEIHNITDDDQSLIDTVIALTNAESE